MALVYRNFCAAIVLLLLALVALRLLPAAPLNAGLPLSQLVRSANGSALRLTIAIDDQYRLWTDLDQIAAITQQALLLKEDRFFYYHPGVNPASLLRAAWATYGRGQRQGGSTVTMQVARRLHRLNTRTVAGKIRQIALSLWLETRYSKKQLFEAYCNLAPMGGNIEGIEAAAQIYFAKPALELTLAESLALAVMPQNPSKRLDFGLEQQHARRLLAERWHERHTEDVCLTALLDHTIEGRGRTQLPFHAPHLTDMLVRQGSSEQVIDTALDLGTQRLIERVLRRFIDEHRSQGVVNAAALLIDCRDMGVKALIGSADYFDPAIQGQVNGVRAKRSPGSTLKPFLYGLAIDQGLIHPLSILKDAPTAFGPFQPENFDGRFVGPLTARDALIRSRNVPAIGLADLLQQPTLYDFLRSAGISRLRAATHYGLALVLGGGELSMEELVELYAILANDGLHRPLRYRQSDPTPSGTRLLSPQAAFLIRDMLAANPPLDPRASSLPSIAWKTGTSWGFRDAWSVGLVGDHVLAVWIGNFDGRSNSAFIGLKTAAPLFFRITDALALMDANSSAKPAAPPTGLIRLEVCAASGDLPNRWCPQTVSTWFIPGKSPIRVCNLHRPVMVDRYSGQGVCPPYDPLRTRKAVFEFWPSDLQRLFAEAGLPRRLPPLSSCVSGSSVMEAPAGDPPRIVSPLTHVVYTLRVSRPDETIGLSASIDADSDRMYWFADNRYLGSCRRDDMLPFRPGSSGRQELSVVDDQGRSVSRSLEVDFVP